MMVMTEEEAKTKWCPFTRAGTAQRLAPVNRDISADVDSLTRCIGSACMAWRTCDGPLGAIQEKVLMLDSGRPEGFTHSEVLEVSPGFNRSFWTKRAPAEPSGYCGLAGSPQ